MTTNASEYLTDDVAAAYRAADAAWTRALRYGASLRAASAAARAAYRNNLAR